MIPTCFWLLCGSSSARPGARKPGDRMAASGARVAVVLDRRFELGCRRLDAPAHPPEYVDLPAGGNSYVEQLLSAEAAIGWSDRQGALAQLVDSVAAIEKHLWEAIAGGDPTNGTSFQYPSSRHL